MWQLRILQPFDGSEGSANVDVEVTFADGRRYAATFCTIANIEQIMESYQTTGECLSGRYFWAANLIIVRDLTEDAIQAAISDMISTGEFQTAFGNIG